MLPGSTYTFYQFHWESLFQPGVSRLNARTERHGANYNNKTTILLSNFNFFLSPDSGVPDLPHQDSGGASRPLNIQFAPMTPYPTNVVEDGRKCAEHYIKNTNVRHRETLS